MPFSGGFDLDNTGVFGWARDDSSVEPVWVEILADDESLGCALASNAEPAGCGFWLPLPSFVFEAGCEIRARIANTNEFIGQGLKLAGKNMEGDLVGEFFLDRGMCFSGWVADKKNPDAKLQLRAIVDGREAASCVADRAAHEINANGHAFILNLPLRVADGKEHIVDIVDSQGRQLPGSPVPVRLYPFSISRWLQSRKKLDEGEKALILRLLHNMEMRVPGILPHADFAAWKKVFPPAIGHDKNKYAWAMRPDGKILPQEQKAARQPQYILFLRPGEKLHPASVSLLVEAMEKSGADLAYADGEDANGEPLLKPAWDRDAFLATDYLGPLLVKKCLADVCGQSGSYSALRFKLAMQAESTGGIVHLARPLSVELPVENDESRLKAINVWLEENHPGSHAVRQEAAPALRISYSLAERPLASILVPTKDHADMLEKCLASLECTAWDNLEIVIMDNGSAQPEALEVMSEAQKRGNVKLLRLPGVFNFAALNNRGAEAASGQLLCFLNNDTEIIHPDWLAEMAALLLSRPDNGCVGAKLLWPEKLVQHGGVVIGADQLASHVGNDWLDDEPGYMWRNQFAQQYSAVTAACMLTPKSVFEDLGGFDARDFAVNFNDTDYCLRLREAGKRVLWTPFAKLLHHESASRGGDESGAKKARTMREARKFRKRWGLYEDPFYNPCLPLSYVANPFYGLATPPRPWLTRKEK